MTSKTFKCRQCRNNTKKNIKNYGNYEACKYDPLIDVEKQYTMEWILVKNLDFHHKCPLFKYVKE